MVILNIFFSSVLLFIGLVTVFKIKGELRNSVLHAHIVVMSLSTISSLVFGCLIGVTLGEHMVLSTIIAILIGVAVGCTFGNIINSFAVISGMTEGVMGAGMGAMTGVMLNPMPMKTEALFAVNFVYFIFVFINITLLYRDKKILKNRAIAPENGHLENKKTINLKI
ncbi:hypothetical protein EWI07_09245 [Sporolactobacillus sp. THM7-4]|nr:hypothetical protein EWI07_09245 [Sporolactobacillus sp. THM7-4]